VLRVQLSNRNDALLRELAQPGEKPADTIHRGLEALKRLEVERRLADLEGRLCAVEQQLRSGVFVFEARSGSQHS